MELSRLVLCVTLHHFAVVGAIKCEDVTVPEGKGADMVELVTNWIKNSGVFPDDNKFLCRVAWVESKYGNDGDTYRKDYHGGIWQVSEKSKNKERTTPLPATLCSLGPPHARNARRIMK